MVQTQMGFEFNFCVFSMHYVTFLQSYPQEYLIEDSHIGTLKKKNGMKNPLSYATMSKK